MPSRASVVALAAAVTLSGCTDQAAKVERKFEIAKRRGASPEELCKIAREVAEAYLEAENERQYQFWDVSADVQCTSARLDPL
ncbi:hypothetical protein IC614_11680 [Allosphingosinicella flava]|uniref:Lipoprotein n=1 Tax=Allosphingosinicella flava TaxID=2771430 RepID=A0A7T2LMD9_9SPHN|nr:hypothetical protein [Sphingosinicella flava]QPQ54952.1 hypothetical protein IC614_11680 [Sphingosinicella flava]